VGKYYIYTKKTMLILNNMFIYKSFYEKNEKKIFQNIVVVLMYEIMNIQMHFQSNYLILWF